MTDLLTRLAALDPARRARLTAELAARGEEFGVHPVSPAQRQLWLLDQLQPGVPVYNVPYAFRLRGRCDTTALAEAVRLLGVRHEALRTVFLDLGGEPRQLILPDPPCALAVTEHPAPAGERDALADRLADTAARRPFDLSGEPLLRVELVRFAADDALLLVTLHHIVCDGWSTRRLFAELGAAYGSLVDGVEPGLGPPPLQYLDFTRWQAEWLAGPAGERLRGYWSSLLAGAPPLLELPTDHPRPAVLAGGGAAEAFTWPGELADRLASFCRAERVTPFMVVLACWNVLLHRYCGAEDLVVGTTVANRGRPGTETSLGCYVNTLALRTAVAPGVTFRALLRQVRDTTLAAQANQELPFDQLVEVLRPPRSTAHHPVFQTLVGMQDGELDILALPGLAVTRVPSYMGTSKWDLELSIAATDGEVAGWLRYDTALFEPDTVARMLGHLRRLLAGAVEAPDRPVTALPMITPAERELVVRPQEPPRPSVALVHEILEDTAARTPDAVALALGDTELTYRALDERANQVAHHLLAAGVRAGDLVGICLPRSFDLVAVMHGVLKAAAAYLPLDPEYPAGRLEHMLRDSATRLVVTTEALAGRLPAFAEPLVLDRQRAAIDARPTTRSPRRTTPDDLAYVIYTSGSTGRPKGAMIPHRGVCALTEDMVGICGLGAADRLLQFASFNFDVSVGEIALALRLGATLVLAAPDGLRPGPDLVATIRDGGVSAAALSPTVLRLLDPADVPGLATVMPTGEACPAEVADTWAAAGRRVINLYGPTEATIWAAHAHLTGGDSPPPIGHPVAGTSCYVLDEHLEPVPVGVPGELYLGGVGVCRGYLGRPDLTAARYLPDPFEGRPGARMYRTGDLARFRRDGLLECLRRIDDQVKVRGYRMELGEIQAAITAHESVRAAVVVTREDVPGDVRLVAYVVPRPGHAVDAAALRAALGRTLPAYMVPSAFVPLATIPRNGNGKLDRRALPDPGTVRDERPVVPVGTGLERTVAGIWREVLRVDRIGAEDNFFDLGGNSLLLARVRARLAEALGRDVPTVALFAHPTVRSLATHFAGEEAAPAAPRPSRRALLTRRREAVTKEEAV